ncbi:MAG: MoxR family ATPase [Actinomycetota bacterium]|nr:MoxR family ATPase [Actinomycetota bacterium]
MQSTITVTPARLSQLLLTVAVVRPPMLWGPPGIGKSSLIAQFAAELGMPCVSLLGTQLAAEDLIGVPQIVDGKSRFCPPEMIAQTEPYVLFLDEINGSKHDVQKGFYSLILNQSIGSYTMPKGSIVIGAGNRSTDSAIVRPMSSALLNRMIHLHLQASPADWLVWAAANDIHPWVLGYLTQRPHDLWVNPPKTEEPFSTPRSWHALSDILHSFRGAPSEDDLRAVAYGTVTASHAGTFIGYTKTLRHAYTLDAILKGTHGWPSGPQDRDLLYFLAETFRSRLAKELPATKTGGSTASRELAHNAKALLGTLAEISPEVAQNVIAADSDGNPILPSWFLVEVTRDLPRLVAARS